jgi:hypothetical protein
MPLKFWDEAFLTAVFLINRLPSKIINNDTPYERLFGTSPDYTFLRSFGCAVWPNLRPYNTRKLEFRSKRCVFLGYSNLHKRFNYLDPSEGCVYISYSNLHKRFNYLDPSEGCVYISRDVVFDEHIFPFSLLHPNAGACLRAELALLPDVLKNPSSDFGSAIMRDQTLVNSLPTNVVSRFYCCCGWNRFKFGAKW